MSDTTTIAIPEIISPLDYFLSLIQIPSITTQFFFWGYLITYLLGFTGNILSFLTFYRPTLRNVSTGCLFIILAISDILYLLISVIDFLEFGVQVRLYRRIDYDALCRFRGFTICVAQLYSAWLLVLITLDRWIRTRFPFKSNSLCTPKKALCAAAILLIIIIGLNSHMLLPFFGQVLPGIPHLACGPNGISAEYSAFYLYQWTVIQIITTSFGPALLMIIMAIDMFIKIRAQKRAIFHHAQPVTVHGSAGRDKRVHNQMILMMLASICIFLMTTFPLTIDHIVTTYTFSDMTSLNKMFISMTILNWIQSLNCAVNFYIHCLSSTLFRKEFIQLVSGIRGRHEPSLTAPKHTKTSHRTQTQRH